jgi:hypothetical protein
LIVDSYGQTRLQEAQDFLLILRFGRADIKTNLLETLAAAPQEIGLVTRNVDRADLIRQPEEMRIRPRCRGSLWSLL